MKEILQEHMGGRGRCNDQDNISVSWQLAVSVKGTGLSADTQHNAQLMIILKYRNDTALQD